MSEVRRPVVVDTDGGIDDAAALWYVLTHPEIEVVGVTAVWGNVGVDTAAANICRVLDAAGRPDIPVAVGASSAIGPAPVLCSATEIHGSDGLGNTNQPQAPFGPVPEPAHDLLAGLCTARPGEVTVLTLGPLTNVARVNSECPEWSATVGALVVMGGAIRVGGNALPAAEANIAHDPEAAASVVLADWDSPPLLVTLDATHSATLRSEELALVMEKRTPAAAFLAAPLNYYRHRSAAFTDSGTFPCHDLCAAVALAEPELLEEELLLLAVDTGQSAAWGATIVDWRIARKRRGGVTDGHDAARPVTVSPMKPWRVALGADGGRSVNKLGRCLATTDKGHRKEIRSSGIVAHQGWVACAHGPDARGTHRRSARR